MCLRNSYLLRKMLLSRHTKTLSRGCLVFRRILQSQCTRAAKLRLDRYSRVHAVQTAHSGTRGGGGVTETSVGDESLERLILA